MHGCVDFYNICKFFIEYNCFIFLNRLTSNKKIHSDVIDFPNGHFLNFLFGCISLK